MFRRKPRKFAILMSIGRVGSNLLVSYLNRSPDVWMVNEFTTAIRSRGGPEGLSQDEISARQKEAFNRFFAGNDDPLRDDLEHKDKLVTRKFRGAKLSVSTFEDPDWFVQQFEAHEISVVRMRRRNLVKAAVSQLRGKAFADYSKEKYGRAAWGVRNREDVLPPSTIDPAELSEMLAKFARRNERFEAFCSCLTTPAIDLEYSEFTRDLEGTIPAVFRFLGVKPVSAPPAFVKATSDDLSEALANFDELRSTLAGTPWEPMLLEGSASAK